MPFSLSVILDPGVRAVDVDELEADATDEVEFKAALFEELLLDAADDEEAVTCCPVGTREGTFRVEVLAVNISTESTLSDEEDEAIFKLVGVVAGTTFVGATVCEIFELIFLE